VRKKNSSKSELEALRKHNEELRAEIEKKHAELHQAYTDVKTLKEHIYVHEPKEIPKYLKIIIPLIIPLLIIGYIVYSNVRSPDDIYTIKVGSLGDNDSSREFYLNQTPDLGVAQSYDRKSFRMLNGITYAVFKPKAILRNKLITVSVTGENVSIVPPVINFSYEDYAWDLKLDSNSGISKQWKTYPENKTIEIKEDCGAYFDGKTRLYLSDTYDEYEAGPFTAYAEWTPQKSNESFQQIIGHYNWELIQNEKHLQFFIGRMNDKNGSFYYLTYPITNDFFNESHNVIAIYSPKIDNSEYEGYAELIVDGMLVSRKNIKKDVIWPNYNNAVDLSIGRSMHSEKYYIGCIGRAMIINEALGIIPKNIEIFAEGEEFVIPIVGNGNLEKVRLVVKNG